MQFHAELMSLYRSYLGVREEHIFQVRVHTVGSSSYIDTIVQLEFKCDCSVGFLGKVYYRFSRFEGINHCI